jgi:hypothetical protein
VDLTELVQGLDGDILDIDWTPSTYAPDSGAAEASDDDDLAAHLKGIDDELGTLASSGGGLTWQTITSDTTASVDNGYYIFGSTITLTLPASPTEGDVVAAFTSGSATSTIDGNGNNVEGSATKGIGGSSDPEGIYLVFDGNWRIALDYSDIALNINSTGGNEDESIYEINSQNEPSPAILSNPNDGEARFDWSNITGIAGVGNLELIESITASSQATVDFTTGIDSDHDDYLIQALGVKVDTNNVNFLMRMENQSGFQSGSSDYAWRISRIGGGGTGSEANESDNKIRLNDNDLENESGEYHTCYIRMFHPSDSTIGTPVLFKGHTHYDSIEIWVWGGGTYTVEETVSGVRLFTSGGNIESGKFRLLGIG